MKAIVQNGYGSADVLEFREIAEPSIKENEVLVRVYSASVNAGDYFTMKGSPWLVRLSVGFPKPKSYVLGWDLAGTVKAVGDKVGRFKPGDEVYASVDHAFAELACGHEDNFAIKPANLTFDQAAAAPTSALTALQQLRDLGKLTAGQKVLINGASGGVGTFAVQIAKSMGAEVTGVCSAKNVDMVRSIGADYTVDYSTEDFAEGTKRYDLILDNVANRSFSDLKRALAPKGVILPNSGHGGMKYVFKAFLLSAFNRQIGRMSVTKTKGSDLSTLKNLFESEKMISVIDRTFSFEDAAKALDYAATAHAAGKVVIQIVPESQTP